MLADAVRAETFRILHNRLALFFSVVLVPLAFAVGGVLFHKMTESRGGRIATEIGLTAPATQPVNLADAFTLAAVQGANGATLVFMLIAAATLYAGDYRWETWRLITPRNDRPSLLLGKVGTVKLLTLATMLLFLCASFVFGIAQGLIYGRPFSFEMSPQDVGDAALLALLAYVRIVQFTLIGLLTAVLSRSLLAALFVPWALGFGQSILGSPMVMGLLGLEPGDWASQLLLPGLAFDTLKNAVLPGSASPMAMVDAATPAVISLTFWVLLPLALALAWFQRQDLSKE